MRICMYRWLYGGVLLMTTVFLLACQGRYHVVNATGEQLVVDSVWDALTTTQEEAVLTPYKHVVDSMMSNVVGELAMDMDRVRPESELTNLVADVLRYTVQQVTNRKADVGLVNMGGVRSALTKGPLTMGNIFEILPFDNSLVVVTYKGNVLLRAMEEIAARGGEGLSGARMVITPDKKLKSVEVNGRPIDPEAIYTIGTIDYLAAGNDAMPSLAQYETIQAYPDLTLRDLFLDYVKRSTKNKVKITSKIEGRVVQEKVVEMAISAPLTKELMFLHTSDTHSRMEPLPNKAADRNAGQGGVVRRMALVDSMRRVDSDLLLVDCGDFSQGTPYYNLFKGDAEIAAMNAMGYTAMTIGNHEFDFGLENMARLFRMANFPVVCSNYDFTGTPLEGIVKPYLVIERKGVRIGLFGISPKMVGLVPLNKCEGVGFKEPIETARTMAVKLREEEACDVVVCLSHLGYDILTADDTDDQELAAATHGIDLILGGHSHSFMPAPKTFLNDEGQSMYIFHSGSRGTSVGKVVLTLEQN